MVDLAKTRLALMAERVDFRIGDFRTLTELVRSEVFDVVYSSFALHHLGPEKKISVIRSGADALCNDGWFVNADIYVAESPLIESLVQERRISGIVSRAEGKDPRFIDKESTRRFLDDLERKDADQPLALKEDLLIMREAGFRGVTVFWMEFREAIIRGYL